jgi:hypothetical protein
VCNQVSGTVDPSDATVPTRCRYPFAAIGDIREEASTPRTGEPVTIRFKGRRRPADVQVLADEPGVVEAYALMARDNHGFANSTGSASTRPAIMTALTYAARGRQVLGQFG